MCVCVCARARLFACLCVCVNECVCACLLACVWVIVCAPACVCVCVHARLLACVCVCVNYSLKFTLCSAKRHTFGWCSSVEHGVTINDLTLRGGPQGMGQRWDGVWPTHILQSCTVYGTAPCVCRPPVNRGGHIRVAGCDKTASFKEKLY